MLVSDICVRTRAIIGDVDEVQFSDATFRSWINDGMRECASDNQLLQIKATINTVVGTAGYAVPADILKLHSIYYDTTKLVILTLREAEERTDLMGSVRGSPTSAYVWANTLTLAPIPDAVKPLSVYYTRNPVDVVAQNDTPELPIAYHQRLVDYCIAQASQADDDLERYNMKMQEFRTGVQQLKDQPEWEQEAYPYISYTGDRGPIEGFVNY